MDRDEITFDSEHRAFRQSRTHYMDQLASGNLIAVTRNPRLENALVDGVEHTRAAREFLDSLVEMEKSFAEKMKLEEQMHRRRGKRQTRRLRSHQETLLRRPPPPHGDLLHHAPRLRVCLKNVLTGQLIVARHSVPGLGIKIESVS